MIIYGVAGGGGNPIVMLVFKIVAYACFVAAFVGVIKSLVRKSLFASAKDIEAIRAMSWREFETLVGEAYRRQGYTVEETGGGGADGGIDLVLRGKGQKILVQCKRWQKVQVDVMIVREMFGLLHHEKADRVIIVTIGNYTSDAVNFASGKPIDLVNGKALVQLIRDVKGTTVSAPANSSVQPAQVAQMGIKTGQMVWITGRPNVVAQDNFILGAMGEALNPSLATFRFPLDIESLLTLRMLDYTVGLKNN